MARYWFYDWLDEQGITTIEAFERALSDARTRSALRESAEEAVAEALSREERTVPLNHSILAGAGLDLSGRMGCRHFECRVDQVNDLFQRAWLYFDRIVVADEIAAELTMHTDEGDLSSERIALAREWRSTFETLVPTSSSNSTPSRISANGTAVKSWI